MHFHRHKGKQILNLQGNLILSKNDDLVSCVSPSAAPNRVQCAYYVKGLAKAGFMAKLRATGRAIAFIWSKGAV